MARKIFTPWGSQIIRSGQDIGGRTGGVLTLLGLVVGLVVSLFWLWLLTVVASVFFGSLAWWAFYAAVCLISYRAVQAYRANRFVKG